MPRSTRRPGIALIAMGLGALLLAGCNMRPLHGGAGGAVLRQDLAGIEVKPMKEEIGQAFRNNLIDDLNPGGISAPIEYVLDVDTNVARNSLLIQLNDEVTRYNLSFAANFVLRRKVDDVVVYRSAVRRAASYNVRREPFATRVAADDAERRAAREVSREIASRLGLWFAERKPDLPPAPAPAGAAPTPQVSPPPASGAL